MLLETLLSGAGAEELAEGVHKRDSCHIRTLEEIVTPPLLPQPNSPCLPTRAGWFGANAASSLPLLASGRASSAGVGLAAPAGNGTFFWVPAKRLVCCAVATPAPPEDDDAAVPLPITTPPAPTSPGPSLDTADAPLGPRVGAPAALEPLPPPTVSVSVRFMRCDI